MENLTFLFVLHFSLVQRVYLCILLFAIDLIFFIQTGLRQNVPKECNWGTQLTRLNNTIYSLIVQHQGFNMNSMSCWMKHELHFFSLVPTFMTSLLFMASTPASWVLLPNLNMLQKGWEDLTLCWRTFNTHWKSFDIVW